MQELTFRGVKLGLAYFSIIISSLVILGAGEVLGQDWNQSYNIWNHNGSVVFLELQGSNRKFYYLRPRPGIAAEGVQPGTLLFAGTRSGHNYVGTAYIFSARCGPIGYPVRGSLSNLDFIRLVGRAPRRDANCNVVSYFDDVLIFTVIDDPTCGCLCPGETAVANYDEWIRKGAVGYSCPYLYAWSDNKNAWKNYGKVLHVAEGKRRESTEEVKLDELSTRFRLAEEEPENAFIDHVQLRVETTDGAILLLKPDMWKLSRRDHIRVHIQAYKSIEFNFTLPEWLNRADVRNSTLVIVGYYKRLLTPACFSTFNKDNLSARH